MENKDIKVLVVDDYAEDRKRYCSLVRKCGYQVEQNSGDSVERAVNTYSPHLVLMDTLLIIGTTGTTQRQTIYGYNLCSSIRDTESGKNIGIVGMSTYPNCEENWVDAGADAFLDKKFIDDTLKPTLEEVLRKHYPDYNPQK